MSSYSENNTFENILERLLSRVSNDLDKREGSIIYDALAPAAAELAQCYIALDVYTDQTYLNNATGINLDNRVADYGLSRISATPAQREITIYNTNAELMDIDIGTRFSIPNEYGGYNFIVTERLDIGSYLVECETLGTAGNEYVGKLLPLQTVNNLGEAIMGIVYKPGENEESDSELRKRAISKINQEPFAGNKASYKKMTEEIDGVYSCKVFPIWNGGGTVKLAIIASGNTIPSSEFIDTIQTIIDPIQNSGEGIGQAPIGHQVTVVAPTKLDVNLNITITIEDNYVVGQLQSAIEDSISNYLKEVQDEFSDKDTLIIYNSRIAAAVLDVPHIINVSDVYINGSVDDLIIQQTGTNIQFPMLGEVVINEN